MTTGTSLVKEVLQLREEVMEKELKLARYKRDLKFYKRKAESIAEGNLELERELKELKEKAESKKGGQLEREQAKDYNRRLQAEVAKTTELECMAEKLRRKLSIRRRSQSAAGSSTSVIDLDLEEICMELEGIEEGRSAERKESSAIVSEPDLGMEESDLEVDCAEEQVEETGGKQIKKECSAIVVELEDFEFEENPSELMESGHQDEYSGPPVMVPQKDNYLPCGLLSNFFKASDPSQRYRSAKECLNPLLPLPPDSESGEFSTIIPKEYKLPFDIWCLGVMRAKDRLAEFEGTKGESPKGEAVAKAGETSLKPEEARLLAGQISETEGMTPNSSVSFGPKKAKKPEKLLPSGNVEVGEDKSNPHYGLSKPPGNAEFEESCSGEDGPLESSTGKDCLPGGTEVNEGSSAIELNQEPEEGPSEQKEDEDVQEVEVIEVTKSKNMCSTSAAAPAKTTKVQVLKQITNRLGPGNKRVSKPKPFKTADGKQHGRSSESCKKCICGAGNISGLSRDALKRHVIEGMFGNVFKCREDNCKASFSKFGSFKDHAFKMHKVEYIEQDGCTMCGDTFELVQEREKHVLICRKKEMVDAAMRPSA